MPISVSLNTLLVKVDFGCTVDHLVLTYIMKSKTELASIRIKRLLDVLSVYSFNLCYMKGKDMILSKFSFYNKIDKSNPHIIIPLSFDLPEVLQEKYYIYTIS